MSIDDVYVNKKNPSAVTGFAPVKQESTNLFNTVLAGVKIHTQIWMELDLIFTLYYNKMPFANISLFVTVLVH